MIINGYKVSDFKLIADGKGSLVKAERPCDVCLGSKAHEVDTSLDGYHAPWYKAKVCKSCMIKAGMFLDSEDLKEQIFELTGGRGRG